MREFYTWKMSENSCSLPRVLLLSGSNEPVRVVIELSSRNGYNDKWREDIIMDRSEAYDIDRMYRR